MPITQLDPPLPLQTPKGPGLAHFVIDYGAETHLLWVVFLDADGACWTVPNPEIRMTSNWSMGRRGQSDCTCRTTDPVRLPDAAMAC
jgi:hypothetical protein